MKKTLNVNIGSVAFVVDEDAYYMLRNYLEDVRSRFDPREQEETMGDLEMRIADIFTENLSSPRQVVGADLVRRTIAVIGRAEDFGEKRQRDWSRPSGRKLMRSRRDRVIGGVCGGLAEYLNIDPTVVRVLMALMVILWGAGLLVYIVLWLVIPSEPEFTY